MWIRVFTKKYIVFLLHFSSLICFLPRRVIQYYQHFTVYQDMIQHFNGKKIIIGKMLNTRCWWLIDQLAVYREYVHVNIWIIYFYLYFLYQYQIKTFTAICMWLSHSPNKYLQDIFTFTKDARLEKVNQKTKIFRFCHIERKKEDIHIEEAQIRSFWLFSSLKNNSHW